MVVHKHVQTEFGDPVTPLGHFVDPRHVGNTEPMATATSSQAAVRTVPACRTGAASVSAVATRYDVSNVRNPAVGMRI